MSYLLPGTAVAATRRFGAQATDVLAVGSTGQLSVLSVTGAGTWSQPLPVSGYESIPPGAGVGVLRPFGTIVPPTYAFVVDNQGIVSVFSVITAGGSWRKTILSGPGTAPPGACIAAAALPYSGTDTSNQTNAFFFDVNGTLTVFYADAFGQWASTQFGVTAAPGAFLVASPHVQGGGQPNQIDLFYIDTNGTMNVVSVRNASLASGPTALCQEIVFPSGAPLAVSQQFGAGDKGSGDQNDVFAVANDGTLYVIYQYGSDPAWASARVSDFGIAAPGTPVAASQQFIPNVNQTDVFLVDSSGALNVFYVVDAERWSKPQVIAPAGSLPPGAKLAASQQFGSGDAGSGDQTDVFVVDAEGNLNVFWVVAAKEWHRLQLPAPSMPLPTGGLSSPGGLRSSVNYMLSSACADLVGVQVDVEITEDLYTSNGVAFQLNCASVLGAGVGWQQYVIIMPPTDPRVLVSDVNNWDPKFNPLIDLRGVLTTIPSSPTNDFVLPAGYRLSFRLTNVGQGAVITGAQVSVTDPSGKVVGNYDFDLSGVPRRGPGADRRLSAQRRRRERRQSHPPHGGRGCDHVHGRAGRDDPGERLVPSVSRAEPEFLPDGRALERRVRAPPRRCRWDSDAVVSVPPRALRSDRSAVPDGVDRDGEATHQRVSVVRPSRAIDASDHAAARVLRAPPSGRGN